MEKFIVAGTQRTGTSMISDTLRSHPDIGSLGEIFHFRGGVGGNTTGSYRQYINQKRRVRTIAHYINRPRLVEEYLDQLYKHSDVKALGFKLMLSQVWQFPESVRYIQKHRIKVLHLVRENFLKTLVSRISAKTRKLYHITKPVNVDKIHVPIHSLLSSLDLIAEEVSDWKQFAVNNPYMELSYESFVADREKELENALTFLGVEYLSLDCRLKKINPDDLSQVIENYSEVERTLAGTSHEKFLEFSAKTRTFD